MESDDIKQKLIEAQKAYIKYLEDAHASTAGYLHAHNWHWDPAMLKQGDDLRALISKFS